jgi:steroid 5-alpha reductase family enzyme
MERISTCNVTPIPLTRQGSFLYRSLQCIGLKDVYKFGVDIDVQVIGGICLFLAGMIGNVKCDAMLRHLRHQGKGYQIPRGFLFEYVSSPNHLCEIMEWLGFAIASNFSKASVAFFLFTCANLLPRALATHSFYVTKFEDYPARRKAVVPLLW